jgi:predicted phage terminase large subunit-like protein
MRDEDGKDYLAVTTVGIDDKWQNYILDCVRVKADEHDTVDTLAKVFNEFKPIKMGFETVAWQKTFKKYVQLLGIMKGIKLPIVELQTDTRVTKRMRIKGMVPYWKAGLFIIPCRDGKLENLTGGMATLVDELTRYPKVANEDTIDALSYITQLTKSPGVLAILKRINPRSFTATRDRFKNKHKKRLGAYNTRKS